MDEKELEKWAKVYIKYRGSEFISLIEDGFDYLKEQSFKVWKKLANFDPNVIYKHHVSTIETLEIVSNFLKTIDPEYPNLFEKCIQDGTIELYDYNSEIERKKHGIDDKHYDAHFTIERIGQYNNEEYLYTNLHDSIVVPLYYDIHDAFVLVHEFFHLLNSEYQTNSADRKIFTESVSISYEYILFDYLVKNNYENEDIISDMRENLAILLSKARSLFNGLIIFDKISHNKDLLNSFKIDYNNEDEIKEIDNNYQTFCDILKYYIGEVIAVLNYKNYREGKLEIEKLENFSYSLNDNEKLESLLILFETLPNSNEVIESIEFCINDIENLKNNIKTK